MIDENRIFERYYVTDCIAADMTDLRAADLVTGFEFTRKVESFPCQPYYDGEVLSVKTAKAPARAVKSFSAVFTEPLDISGRGVLAFGFNSRSDSNFLRVTIVSQCGRSFESLLSVQSERWSYILVDISGSGISAVSELRFEMYGVSDGEFACSYQFAEIRFGNILDLDFRRGGQARFYRSDGVICQSMRGLRFSFKKGNSLMFPRFPRARYTVCNMLFGLYDTVNFIIKNHGGRADFKLYLATDRHPDFDETRAVVFSVDSRSTAECVSVPVAGVCEDGERLLCMKLTACGSGEVELCGTSFSQEQRLPLPAEEETFLSRRGNAENPWNFSVPRRQFDVRDFGAAGDGATCDNAAIQSALNEAAKGGGKVFIPRGKYVITNLRVYSNTEIAIEAGGVLVQSRFKEDYPYDAQFGHDNIHASVNWAHNFLVANMPLIYADGAENVKVSGGEVRCMSAGCDRSEVGFPYWPEHCGGVIHAAPFGFNRCKNVSVTDVTVRHSGTYHMFFAHCENVFVCRAALLEVRCLSADGIGLCGSKNVLLSHCFIKTNDDGVTLFSVYDDPRAGKWWKSTPGEDNSVRNVEIASCYVNSACGGEGKAIAFIPWGTDAPDVSLQQIDGIYVHDCILTGGFSVGTWPDNPYNGKQPFDNSETDDFSPVMNVRIVGNQYRSAVSLECITATSVVSDCGLASASEVVNGEFKDLSNWNTEGEVSLFDGGVRIAPGSALYQGLNLKRGDTLRFTVGGSGEALVGDGGNPSRTKFSLGDLVGSVAVTCPQSGEVVVGVRAGDVSATVAKIEKE